MAEESAAERRIAQGRDSYYKGQTFEERVADLYRLLRYRVQVGRLFSGRQVDLFLEGQFGDATLRRAIECKAGQVQADDIDAFSAKLRLVQREHPDALGTLVSGVGFTDAVAAHAAAVGIQLTLARDLEGTLIDSHGYVTNLLRVIEDDTVYPLRLYVDQLVAHELGGDGVAAMGLVEEWLTDGDWNHMTVLGDVGTGKSFLTRVITHQLAKAYLASPQTKPFPILVDLRNADREFSLEGLIITHATRHGLGHASFDVIQYLIAQGRIVMILDGFDEMATRVTSQTTARNFNELIKAVRGRAKVMLTCRTHYFRSREEEEHVVFGTETRHATEAARELYWELISRKGYRVAYLLPFTMAQIEEYVRKARPNDAVAALERIRSTYNLMELSQRPMLLEMIVKSIDALRDRAVNAASLYQVFTDAWIHRDKWRDVLPADVKLALLKSLATTLWKDDVPSVHYSDLIDHIKCHPGQDTKDIHGIAEVDHEVRTASFLIRDERGNYSFAHKSYLEFFLATDCARRLADGDSDCLATRRLSPETVGFLCDLLDLSRARTFLETVLTGGYQPSTSENALMILYAIERQRADVPANKGAPAGSGLRVCLPERMQLQGSHLEQMVLSGAVMRFANLSDAQLTEAHLIAVDLSEANCEGASFERSDLRQANCRQIKLDGARMSWANLEGADFSAGSFHGAVLTNAYIENATFDGSVGVDTIRAEGVLSLDADRLQETAAAEAGDEFWEAAVRVLPLVERVARRTVTRGSPGDLEAHDLTLDTIVRLATPRMRERFLARSERERLLMARNVLLTLVSGQRRRERFLTPSPTDQLDPEQSGDEQLDLLEASSGGQADNDGYQRVLRAELTEQLSEAAVEVLDLYLEGHSINDIAHRLKLAPATVHGQVATIRQTWRKLMES